MILNPWNLEHQRIGEFEWSYGHKVPTLNTFTEIIFSLSYFDHWVFAGATELPNLNLMAAISRILSPLLLQFSTHPFLLQKSFLIYSASGNLPRIEFIGIERNRRRSELIFFSKPRWWRCQGNGDSSNCSIDWLWSSCWVLTKYRHSETADYKRGGSRDQN